MARRVLVTRPQPGAARTAARVTQLGFTPVVMPLTRIVGLVASANGMRPDAVVATSANALRQAPAALLHSLLDCACFAVGTETAQAARQAGFGNVVEGRSDAGALLSQLTGRMRRGDRVTYLCGTVRTEGLERGLAAAGIAVEAIETYDTPAIPYDRAAFEAVLSTEPIAAVLLYSARAADLFLQLPWENDEPGLAAGMSHLCLSRQVANRLQAIPKERKAVANHPTEDAMMRLLAGTVPASFQDRLV